jgi:hypothetical protein
MDICLGGLFKAQKVRRHEEIPNVVCMVSCKKRQAPTPIIVVLTQAVNVMQGAPRACAVTLLNVRKCGRIYHLTGSMRYVGS